MNAPDPPTVCPLCGGTQSVRYRSVWSIDFRRPDGFTDACPPLTSCLPCFREYRGRVLDAVATHAAETQRLAGEARAAMAARSCLGCRYYRASWSDYGTITEDFGVCCRHAPIGYKDDDGDMRTYWPTVSEESSCGDREAKDSTP